MTIEQQYGLRVTKSNEFRKTMVQQPASFWQSVGTEEYLQPTITREVMLEVSVGERDYAKMTADFKELQLMRDFMRCHPTAYKDFKNFELVDMLRNA
jgi:hypothetical protein